MGLFSDLTGRQRFHDEEKKIMADWYRYCLTNVHKKSYNFTITQLKPTKGIDYLEPIGGIDYLHNIDFMAHSELVLLVWEDKDYLTGKFKPINPQFAPSSTVSGKYPHTIWNETTKRYKMTQPDTFFKHYEPQLMYGAKLSNLELADMPGVKTFGPGASNAVWSFNWHRPKKDFQWKESVEWEQNDWLYKSEVPGTILTQMADATGLDVKDKDRRGEMMRAGAVYFQQLAKKKTSEHCWTWDKQYTMGDKEDAYMKLQSNQFTVGKPIMQINREDWPNKQSFNCISAMHLSVGGTTKPVPFMYMELDSFNLEKEYEVTIAWEERINFTWACQGNRRMLPKRHYQVATKPTLPFNNWFGIGGEWTAHKKQAYTVNNWDNWVAPTVGESVHEQQIEERHKAFANAPRKMSLAKQRISNKRRARYWKNM